MSSPLLAILVNHLWQSTLFAGGIWGLTLLLRRNSARVRYSLWLAASLKFLLPFAALAALGSLMPWHMGADASVAAPRIVELASDFTAPLAGEIPFPGVPAPGEERPADFTDAAATIAALFVWLAGALLVAVRWLVRWLEVRRVLRRAQPLTNIEFPAPVLATGRQFEPGVVGVFHPKLLLPAGIDARLTPEQLRAVLAHERCHLQRRDNLTASLHMLVEALFWFFPLVWWIGARLIDERERACDEQVIRDGHTPESYAEGILNVCEHYIASRLPCVSGVSGADLGKRIDSIVKRTLGIALDRPKKLALAAVACCTISAPLIAGMFSTSPLQALLSLDIPSVAQLQYFRVGNAALDAYPDDNLNYREYCPTPGAALPDRQRALAALAGRLSAGDDKALMYAVAANSHADVKRLLDGGASRKGDGFLQSSALMHTAVMVGDTQMLELLMREGFDINGVSTDGIGSGDTPLMRAASMGRYDNARWLIEHGANVNYTDKYGNSALAHALVVCRSRNLAALLIQSGAKPNAKALRIADNLGVELRTESTPTAPQAPAPSHPAETKPVPAAPDAPAQGWRPIAEGKRLTADLDGDGREDQVVQLLSVDGRQEGLFVNLSRTPGTWIKAAQSDTLPPHDAPSMGMSVAKAGTYPTLCGKGYRRLCRNGQPTDFTMKYAGIDYWVPESASSVFYWDEATQQLKREWTSD